MQRNFLDHFAYHILCFADGESSEGAETPEKFNRETFYVCGITTVTRKSNNFRNVLLL